MKKKQTTNNNQPNQTTTNPQTQAQPVQWHGIFAGKSGAQFILTTTSISFYSSVTDFFNVSELFIWLEIELIKTTLTTLIFCYKR